MELRNPLKITNDERRPLTVIVEPWAREYVLAPGEECEVVGTHPDRFPSLQVVLSPHGLIVWVNDNGSAYELWKGGALVDS